MKAPAAALVNRTVEVVASGITYKGVLKEITEDEVKLWMETGWMTISMDKVNVIRSTGETKIEGTAWDIPPDFYKDDDEKGT